MAEAKLFIIQEIIEYYTDVVHKVTKKPKDSPTVQTSLNKQLLKIEPQESTFSNFKKTNKPSNTVLFETDIEAGAGESTVKLNIKRSSTSVATFDISQGVVSDNDLEFHFPQQYADIEEVLRGRAGMSKKFRLDHSKQNVIENESEWNIEATLTVKEGQASKFTVLLQEMDVEADFVADVHVSGKVKSYSDTGKSFEPKDIIELVNDLKKLQVPDRVQEMLNLIDISGKKLVVPIVGHCHFQYGIGTKISSKALGKTGN